MGSWWLRLANYRVGAVLLAACTTRFFSGLHDTVPQAEQHFGLELQLLSDITQFHGDGLGTSIAHVLPGPAASQLDTSCNEKKAWDFCQPQARASSEPGTVRQDSCSFCKSSRFARSIDHNLWKFTAISALQVHTYHGSSTCMILTLLFVCGAVLAKTPHTYVLTIAGITPHAADATTAQILHTPGPALKS